MITATLAHNRAEQYASLAAGEPDAETSAFYAGLSRTYGRKARTLRKLASRALTVWAVTATGALCCYAVYIAYHVQFI